MRELDGRGYQVAGRPKAEDIGRIASLEVLRISPLPQWERVYKKLEQELCIRVLFDSVRIIEAPLAEYFGVSRTVARDVLGRMHSVGVLHKDGLGRWIAQRASAEKIRELFEMRTILEPEALLRAAPLVSREELELIRNNVQSAISGGPVEIGAIGQLETDLHIDLLASCPNQEIIKALDRTHLLFVPSLYLLNPSLSVPEGAMDDALDEHLEIIDQLPKENYREAAAALRVHLKEAASRWLRRFEVFAKADRSPMPSYLVSLGSQDN